MARSHRMARFKRIFSVIYRLNHGRAHSYTGSIIGRRRFIFAQNVDALFHLQRLDQGVVKRAVGQLIEEHRLLRIGDRAAKVIVGRDLREGELPPLGVGVIALVEFGGDVALEVDVNLGAFDVDAPLFRYSQQREEASAGVACGKKLEGRRGEVRAAAAFGLIEHHRVLAGGGDHLHLRPLHGAQNDLGDVGPLGHGESSGRKRAWGGWCVSI